MKGSFFNQLFKITVYLVLKESFCFLAIGLLDLYLHCGASKDVHQCLAMKLVTQKYQLQTPFDKAGQHSLAM